MKTKVTVVIEVLWIDGSKSFNFPLQEFIDRESTTDLILNSIGVSEEDYLEWIENDGKVRCEAQTKIGRRCTLHVTGPRIEDPSEWVKTKALGGYCSIHGGS